MKKDILAKINKYHFEWKHLLVLFLVIIVFQIIVSYIQKISSKAIINQTHDWYKKDSAEKLANMTTTALELLLETNRQIDFSDTYEVKNIIQAFNIILSQQLLHQNVHDICILISVDDSVKAIDNGRALFKYLYLDSTNIGLPDGDHRRAVGLYQQIASEMLQQEQITSFMQTDGAFDVFVPLVPNGEYAGALYLKIIPDFSFISQQIKSGYDEIALIFFAFVLFGLLAMFYISSYTIKERDETQALLFQEQEKFLYQKINHQKESLFTKRIYHTHHKAEKVMGFIKEDLQNISPENIPETKYQVTKYANFISRVIYDMKWYDPPVQTIRNPIFRTRLNEVIQFIVDSLFQRITKNIQRIQFELDLDPRVPVIHINEFVVWEIMEPLMQNSIDHSEDLPVSIKIRTVFIPEKHTRITIQDNGHGIPSALLKVGKDGIKKIFQENISTKTDAKNTGYGCYLAHQIARRCGWSLDARNRAEGGCEFVIDIPYQA